MKAVTFNQYGPPDVLQLKEVKIPEPGVNELLVKVHATTVNRTDCATIRAKPFFMRLVTGLFKPRKQIPGTEFAGEIMAVGRNVLSFQVGDRVFGFDDEGAGAQAQYLTILEDKAITIPEGVKYEQAAASSEGAHYAYNFINKVDLQKGQSVLVNGASGAIGSAAVQLLKYFDVNITAVCATKNLELVKQLGASKVIDYTKQNFANNDDKYNYVFDTVGKSSFFKCMKLLKPGGVYISSDLGYMSQNIYLPFITQILSGLLDNKKTLFPVPSDIKRSLYLIHKLIEQGKYESVIDRRFSLEQIIEAYKYVEKGQKTGNVVITVEHEA